MDKMKYNDIDMNQPIKPIYHTALGYGCSILRPAIAIILEQRDTIFENDNEKRVSLLREMADDYLSAADQLIQSLIVKENEMLSVNRSFIPIGYLCRHAIELKLKECLYAKGHDLTNKHDLQLLFNRFNWDDYTNEEWFIKTKTIIDDISTLDNDGFHLRYGFATNGSLYDWDFYMFNPYNFVYDTKFVFNVFTKYGDVLKLK